MAAHTLCLVVVLCIQPMYTQMYTTKGYPNPQNTLKTTAFTTIKATPSFTNIEIAKLRGEMNNLQTQISYLQQKYSDLQSHLVSHNTDRFVAFEARLGDSLMGLGRNQIVLFDNVLMNKGNGYDKRIGVFRCPVNGTYQVTLSVACFGRIQLELVNNGIKVGHLFASQRRVRLPVSKRNANLEKLEKRQMYPSATAAPTTMTNSVLAPTRPSTSLTLGSEAATASIQFLVDLVVGDDVWVRHLDNGLNAVLLSDIYTTFSGHLIHAQ